MIELDIPMTYLRREIVQIASPIARRLPAVPGFQRKDMEIRISGRAWQSGRHGSALVLNAFVNLQQNRSLEP